MNNELITVDEAALLAGVKRDRIYHWAYEGRIVPVARDGQRPLYRALDVLQAERDSRRRELVTCQDCACQFAPAKKGVIRSRCPDCTRKHWSAVRKAKRHAARIAADVHQ